MAIKASDVAKLRTMTGAGMMDCKNALQETDGDFDAAIDALRKKGQKVASKRADREATEGAIISKVSADGKIGAIVMLNCETDFVAKNDDFVAKVNALVDLALTLKADSLEALNAAAFGASTVAEELINFTGVTGEKVEIGGYQLIEAAKVAAYIHPGNKVATLVGFNETCDEQVCKDIAMQIAAMAPIALDKGDVSQEVIDKEIEIGKELAINEGKPADMAEKISLGRLNKFFAESTLLNQQFIKDNKVSISQYLKSQSKTLTATAFKRFSLQA
ncbi:MAG: Elongation factor Ts [Bacteroidota bacterium]|jgi:elongation factor Ts